MKKIIIRFMVFLIVLIPFKAGAEEIIKKGESLNLERCVEIALKMQPNIIAAMNTSTQMRAGSARQRQIIIRR